MTRPRNGIGRIGLRDGLAALVLAACLLTQVAPAQPTDAELRTLAAAFPPMPRETADLVPFVVGTPTFASGTPIADTNYTLFDTDYVDGENGGYDVFLPVDPSDPFPGADTVKLIRCALNTDLDLVYGVTPGDRVILGTAEHPRPFFRRGDNGRDDDYAVIQHFSYRHGHIQLRGDPAEYRLLRVTLAQGARTDGWYLFHVADGPPDLIAFIFPCDVVFPAVSGNPPVNPNPYCFGDGSLSLANAAQFRYASPIDPTPTMPRALLQFGGPGKEIVGGIAADDVGNVYIVGAGDSNLDGNAIDDADEIFVMSIRNDGTRAWVTELPLPDGSLLWDAAADDRHLYVAGRTLGALPGFINAGRWDGILLKLRLVDGAVVATNQWGRPGIDGYGNILLDGRGNLYVSGQGSPAGPATNDNAYLVAKHRTSDLSNVWRAVDPVPVAGFAASAEAWGGLSLIRGTTPEQDRLVAAGWYFAAQGADAFVTVYDNLQNPEPSRPHFLTIRSPGARAEWVFDSAVGPQGHVYVVGYTTGSLQGPPLGRGDAFIMRLDPTLTNPIIRQFGTAEMDTARDVAIDAQGRIWVFGYTHGDLARPNPMTGGLSSDLFVRRFDANLATLDSIQFGTPYEDQGRASLVRDAMLISGITEGSLDAPSRGSFDGFIALLEGDLTPACAVDVNADGRVDVLDLFLVRQSPIDINDDGTADFRDAACLERHVRRHERVEMTFGRH
ncbi:MAG: hypothetical protein RL689_1129 [Planctomycetota bacterium]|jgi:hypothetical protein